MIILAQDIDVVEINTFQLVSLTRQALELLLYVPDERLKPRIIQEILDYYGEKFQSPEYESVKSIPIIERTREGPPLLDGY